MASILAHIVIHEGKEAEFEMLAAKMFAASHATEENLRAYGYWRAAEPQHYYTLLGFDDYMGFMEHQSSDHHEGGAIALRACIASIRLEWLDPVPGASKLSASNPQTIPDDASDVVKRYAKAMPVQVAQWWKPLRGTAK
jgi:quinol monooxygenase YgiN